jgi:hypothetical protein
VALFRWVEVIASGLPVNMDILRWKIAHIVNNGPIYTYNNTQKLVRKFDVNRDYLWPVPSYETQENPNLLPNNPGW